jgi:regulator of protease activity HflC (stomatin/prohibitin superfamily)
VTDAHPPREVVPAYRDVSAAVSDAARYRNEAEAYASQQRWSSRAEAASKRDTASALGHRLKTRAEGERRGFLARVSAHSARPDLTEFGMLWDTLSLAYAGRPKMILDPKAGGRRNVWLTDPAALGLTKPVAVPQPIPIMEPED